MHFVKPATVPLVALSLLALFTIAPAQAQFLVDPAGGTTVHSPGAEDASVRRQTGLASFSFFGTPLAPANAGETISVFVNVNGNLSLQSDAAQFRQFPNAVASIAPLFTDLSVPGNGSITEKIMTGQYYAVTYNNIKPFGQEDTNPARFSFQAVLFGQTTTIQTQNGSFTFAPNDIAFSYANTSADFPAMWAIRRQSA